MGASQVAEALDVFFYCTYHADLKGLSDGQARRHYRRQGRREARTPNPSAMLHKLQMQEGKLPHDFCSKAYAELNRDLELRHAWQAAEHYLRHGRHHGRRYCLSKITTLTDRSSTERLRNQLAKAFGEAAAHDGLVLDVHRAVSAATESATAASALMHPIQFARWLMSAADPSRVAFGRLDVQLNILFRAIFKPLPVACRSAVEMEVINRLRSLAINTEVCDAGSDRPAVTLLMLAAEAAYDGRFSVAPGSAEAAALVARFFTLDVPRLGLQRFVTPGQRARLRAPAASQGSEPLAALLLREVWGGPGLDGAEDPGPPRSFQEREV